MLVYTVKCPPASVTGNRRAAAIFPAVHVFTHPSFTSTDKARLELHQTKSILAVKVGSHVRDKWLSQLSQLLPDVDVQDWHTVDRTRVDFAAVWKPESGALAAMPALKGIVSIAAGADHILDDPHAPVHIPIVRCTGEPLQARMSEYVVLHALGHHRRSSELEAAQLQRQWQPLTTRPASHAQVGIMGMGVLGRACVAPLRAVGFQVAGWTRTARPEDNASEEVRIYAGATQLDEFLRSSNILVCLLPSTSETRDLIDRDLLNKLPAGACVINVARGDLLVEDDLIKAIESGHIREATLDVFRVEPLPPDHVFWQHDKIRVTPHVASLIDSHTGSALVAAHVRRFVDGDKPQNLVDPDRGY